MRTPDLSVVIPAYNAERHVGAAISSALTQTGVKVEVVVVDDGSTDATPAVLAGFADVGVRVERQDNAGPAAARNHGIRLATAPVIGFLDADDALLPGWGARLCAALDDGAAIAVADALVVGGEAATHYYDELEFPPTEKQRRRIVRENFVLSTCAVRRDALERHGGFDEALKGVEDWDLWMRIVLGGGRVVLVDEPLSLYRRGHASLSSDVAAMKRAEIALLERLGDTRLPRDIERERRRGLRRLRAIEQVVAADARRDRAPRRAGLAYVRAAPALRDPRLGLRGLAHLVRGRR